MQFYIVHPNPAVNVCLLPEYALKKVNIREGWQILSDIGHRYGVSWPGQNKLYSASHVLTRRHGRSWKDFKRFIRHYDACVRWKDIRASMSPQSKDDPESIGQVEEFLMRLGIIEKRSRGLHGPWSPYTGSLSPGSLPSLFPSPPAAKPHWKDFLECGALQELCEAMPWNADEEADTIRYLLENKDKHLSEGEKETLRRLI